MGCDIHWYSETKKNGVWVCDQAASFSDDNADEIYDMSSFSNEDRDYWFFGLLADGVRTEVEYSFPIHGFPGDASIEVSKMQEQWDCDAHSLSHLTREDLKDKLDELKLLRAEYLIQPTPYELDILLHNVKRLEETIDSLDQDVADSDQRIVFWFDN